jgi:hypothetical protein
MIDLHQSRRLAERQLWSGYVQQLFQTLEIADRTAAPDITESLAVFCQHRAHMPEHTLSLLMARSFCITGDAEAAGRILRHDRAHRPHTESWLEVLSAEYPFPELYSLFSSRALRPQSLTSAGTVWVLDFDRIHLTEADRHELILFQTVRVLTEEVSNVWTRAQRERPRYGEAMTAGNGKKADGQGTLGIKGLSRLTKFIRGRHPAKQLTGHISDVLALCAQKNGWSAVPAVLLIDL